MKKYGLQLRPAQVKKAPRPPLPTAPIFRDNDDDDVEQDIARQASKTKSHKDVEEQHKKALEEDPSVFDYDGVYDDMKQKIALPKAQEREERRPKYILALMKKQEQRQREQDMIYERKIAKERSKEDHLYSDKDKFVTSAYKKKLAEQEKWMKEEQIRQLREEKEDVTKKKDLSDFYFNLEKNVAFGAEDVKSRKPEKQTEVMKPEKQTEVMKPVKQDDEVSADLSLRRQPLTESRLGPERADVEDRPPAESSSPRRRRSESVERKTASEKPVSGTSSGQETTSTESPPAAAQPKDDSHHKRDQDAIAAAKERFLARKKSKLMI